MCGKLVEKVLMQVMIWVPGTPLSGKLAPLGFVPLEPLKCRVLPTASMSNPLFLNNKLFNNKILGSPKSMS
jgi:hypothetical protein